MSNLTVSVDEQLIKRARMRAIEQGTSLSAKVREFLQGYVNGSQEGLAQQRAEATARLLKAMEAAAALAAPAAPATTAPTRRRSLRVEIYEGDFRARSRAAASASAKSPRAKKPVEAAKAGKGTGARAR
jgi:plasmid stability protein